VALARAQRAEADVALLFIDLDGFKPINDTHGHAAGDAVLKAVASRVQAALRASDFAARLGGDEFVIILDAPQTA
jgi:diguanylate cyclase (GGDEF)-like protein